MSSEESWVSIGEVAAHLSVGKDSIYRWIDTRGFPSRRVGRLLRFRLSEVDEWVEGGGGNEPETRPAGRPNGPIARKSVGKRLRYKELTT